MFGLETGLSLLLIICLLCACFFEFVNGFHDTANAVATVIYTKSLKPAYAVVWSGFLNFLGVFFGGISVATGIITLLPVETLTDPNILHNMAVVLAILITAIIWNLATWWVAIPCSSSHTLVGSILGIGLGFFLLPNNGVSDPINWKKAQEIGSSLLISPLFGFSLAVFLMFLMRRILTKKSIIFKEPEPDQKPPLWIRIILIITCSGVSFFHGSNDGQKGVGLMMLILIAIVPGYFALNSNLNVNAMVQPAARAIVYIEKIDQSEFSTAEKEEFQAIYQGLLTIKPLVSTLSENQSSADSIKFQIRKNILLISKGLERLQKTGKVGLSENNKNALKAEITKLRDYTDYAPDFVLLLISVSLGLGTMIGWKRIVVTIGEKIGKQHLTYAQGAAAELVATATIGASTGLGLPVSTTHVLSSGIAGSMVASKGIKNLQAKTIRNILIAWVLTLPVCMVMSGLLFWLFRSIL